MDLGILQMLLNVKASVNQPDGTERHRVPLECVVTQRRPCWRTAAWLTAKKADVNVATHSRANRHWSPLEIVRHRFCERGWWQNEAHVVQFVLQMWQGPPICDPFESGAVQALLGQEEVKDEDGEDDDDVECQ
jgi:hypothetical protein